MGAAVGFRSGLSRNWTGSLSELNHCRPHLGRDTEEQFGHYSPPGFLSWHDGESDLSEPDDMKIFRGNVVDYVRSSSSVGTSLLKFRHLLRTIHKSLSDENVPHGIAHEEQNSPSLSPARNNHVQNTDYLTSADSLIESLFDDHLERMLLHSRRLYFHQRSKRRNCASESDLRWSSLDDLNAFPLESNSSQPREFKDEKASSQDTKSTSDQYVDKRQCATEKSAPLVTHFPSSIPVDIYGTDTKNESELTASDYRMEEQTNKLEEVSPDVAQPPSSERAEKSLSENYLCVCASLQKVAEYGKEEPVIMLEVAKATDSLNSLEIGLKDRSASIEFEVTQPTTKLQKSVIFADEVGKSLTETFVFHREESFKSYDYDSTLSGSTLSSPSRTAQCAAYFAGPLNRSRLKNCSSTFDNMSVMSKSSTNPPTVSTNNESARTVWSIKFPQPASKYYEFRQRIENNAVSLENISITPTDDRSDSQLPQLSGTIKVKNLSFEKQVWIRLTTDHWQSYTDHMALYSPALSSGMLHPAARFDTFTFQLVARHQLESDRTCDRIEFAIRYMAGPNGSWGQYWDNNNGQNYVIERTVVQSIWPSDTPQSILYSTGVALEMKTFDASEHSGAADFRPYTPDYRPNFDGFKELTTYRAWDHFSNETTYY